MSIGRKNIGFWPITACILGFLLLIMIILFVIQTLFIRALVIMAIDLAETEVLIQTQSLEGVDREEIRATFARLRKALPRGQINLRKTNVAARYVQQARSDDEWTADEVNTLLDMMNAALK